ncbi:MAG: phosphatidate cytidylyltransferase [Vampirovibrio sp.]|nr:phosphatidate cytidylyltransferase [Vampirovibrio sp.]
MNNPVIQMGILVFGLLAVATLVVELLKWRKPEADFEELALRTRSWWWMAGFFFLSLMVHSVLSLMLFGFLSFLALKEYFSLVPLRFEDHRALLWAYIAIPLQYWWIHTDWKAMVVIFIPVYMFLFIPLRLLLKGQPKGMITSMAQIQWGLMLFVYCISHVAFLLILVPTDLTTSMGEHIGSGKALVLYLVVLTEVNDVAQYFWGKLLGGKPIGNVKVAPIISPKKTLAGLAGGVLTTTTLAVGLQFLSGFSLLYSIAAGLLISVAGFIGDLVISAVKRDVGVKDSGTLIPGHGGMLDRVDSLAYTAPLFFHFVNYFFFQSPW